MGSSRPAEAGGPGPESSSSPVAATAPAAPWTDPTRRVNIAEHLPVQAARFPWKRAVVFPEGRDASGRVSWTHLTFAQLETETNRLARGLAGAGVVRGTRVLVMMQPGIDFIAVTFALFKLGAVPILIDPGMGRGSLLECIAKVEPEVLIAVPLAQGAASVFPAAFRSVRLRVTVGRRWLWGGLTLDEVRHSDGSTFAPSPTTGLDEAAILFTTGSTGPPKGVVYLHGIFDAQVHMIREAYGIRPDDVDLPGFPLFALFSTAWGMTCVIPDMDPRRPAQVDPVRIVEAIEAHGVTTSFGSPAIWKRVGAHCVERGIRLPSVKRILAAGAPVPGELVERMRSVLPEGDLHTPYGATECLPVASLAGAEICGETWARSREGAGICVGRALPGNSVRIVGIRDEAIPEWDDSLALPVGEVGEIVVDGPVVTPRYQGLEAATRAAKIRSGGRVLHRMGDLGYLDREGRLWFCGRKAHRVEAVGSGRVFYSVCCEAIVNRHPRVERSALVGVDGVPVLVVEPRPGSMPESPVAEERFRQELRELAAASQVTEPIDRFLFHPSFPVDIRHNAKIFREKLAVWARDKP